MILPTITAISRDALISLHSDLRQAQWDWVPLVGKLSQGATSCLSGIVGAVMLAFVAYRNNGSDNGDWNSNNINSSILAPSNTIPSLLANQFAEASGLQVAALMRALILFGITLVNIPRSYWCSGYSFRARI